MKRNSAVLLAVLAAAGAQADETLVITPNSQIAVQISNESPNAISVANDRITQLYADPGAITDKDNTPNGAMVFSTTSESPISFFVETEKGFFFSVLATPIAGPGHTLDVSNKLARGTKAAGVWEKSLNYEEMLVSLNKQLLNGQMPDGFIETKNFTYAPAGEAGRYLKLKPLNAWVGEELRVIKFVARNTSGQYLELDGSMFWARGVRSVYVDRDVRKLGPEREVTLMITLSDQRGER